MTSQPKPSQEAYQLKITLADSVPEVWRRVIVPADITLAQLHLVIQQAMGWENRHPYQFHSGLGQNRSYLAVEQPLMAVWPKADITADSASPPLYYSYDPQSGWLHRIEREALAADRAQAAILTCTGGESACPLEDSGGVWGYDELLARLEDTEDPDYLALLDQYGDFDPDAFDLAEANARLSTAFL